MLYASLFDLKHHVPLEKVKAQYLHLLSHLTVTQDVPIETFRDALDDIEACGDIQVAYTAENGCLFLHGAATVFYETKLTHGCKKVGHIEDLVVLPESRRMGIARSLLFRIRQQAAKECYKVILDCREELVPFYESCSLVRHGSQMSYYFH